MQSQNKRTRTCHKYKTFIAFAFVHVYKIMVPIHSSLDQFLSLNIIHTGLKKLPIFQWTCFSPNKRAHRLKNIYTSNLNYTRKAIQYLLFGSCSESGLWHYLQWLSRYMKWRYRVVWWLKTWQQECCNRLLRRRSLVLHLLQDGNDHVELGSLGWVFVHA